MSVALSTAEEDAFTRAVDLTDTPVKTPQDLIAGVYPLRSCTEWILQNDFKRVALQFPDHLLQDSILITQSLEQFTGRKIFILGDTTYGSCCVDEIAAEHGSCDSIIHFGHSCLSPTSRLPVALVFPRPRDFDVADFRQKIEELRNAEENELVCLYDSDYFPIIGMVAEFLQCSSMVVPENQTVLLDDPSCLNYLHSSSDDLDSDKEILCRRAFTSFLKASDSESRVFVYVGKQSSSMVNFFLSLPSHKFYSYDPSTKDLTLESPQINKRIMRRYYLIEKAKDAQIVGILIGTLGVKDYLDIIERLKKILKGAGKKFYTFSMGKPNPAKLANFMEVDVFVYVACPESLFDSKEYVKPIVTPHEMEIAYGQRAIDEGFVADFRQLLPGGNSHVGIKKVENDTPDISLISGKARYVRNEEEDSTGDAKSGSESTALVSRDQLLTVAQYSAGDYFSTRSWRGLQPEYGEHSPGEIVEGRHGIALSYEQEGNEATKENHLVSSITCGKNSCGCDDEGISDGNKQETLMCHFIDSVNSRKTTTDTSSRNVGGRSSSEPETKVKDCEPLGKNCFETEECRQVLSADRHHKDGLSYWSTTGAPPYRRSRS